MFRKTVAMKFDHIKASFIILSVACTGVAGSAMAEPQTAPRTNATWYDTYAEDAIANANRRDRVVVARERDLFVPYRYGDYDRHRFFKRHEKGKHAGKLPTVRPSHRRPAYNPRAALLRSGISR
jgi:hypothetical protein